MDQPQSHNNQQPNEKPNLPRSVLRANLPRWKLAIRRLLLANNSNWRRAAKQVLCPDCRGRVLAQERQWLDPPSDEVEAEERARFEPLCTTCGGQGVVCPVCRGMRWVRMANEPVGSDRRIQACVGCMGAIAGDGKASVLRTKELETIERFLRKRLVYLPPFDQLDPELRAEDDEELRRRDREEVSFDDAERQRCAAIHHQRWNEISGANQVEARRQKRLGGERLADLDASADQLDAEVAARYGAPMKLGDLLATAQSKAESKADKRQTKQGNKQP